MQAAVVQDDDRARLRERAQVREHTVAEVFDEAVRVLTPACGAVVVVHRGGLGCGSTRQVSTVRLWAEQRGAEQRGALELTFQPIMPSSVIAASVEKERLMGPSISTRAGQPEGAYPYWGHQSFDALCVSSAR